MNREIQTVHTAYGDIRKKVSSGYGVTKEKYEYDDISKIAIETGKSLAEIKKDL